MNRLAVLALLAVALIGCTDRDETDVKLNAAVAYASAKQALSTAWTSVSTEAAKLTANSSQSALEEAKRQTANLQAQLSKIEIKNPINEAQMEAARQQMAKIEAALNLQKLQKESEAAVQNAMSTGRVAQQKYEEASKQLAQLDASYRDLEARRQDALAIYENATATLNGAMARVKELTGN